MPLSKIEDRQDSKRWINENQQEAGTEFKMKREKSGGKGQWPMHSG
jgi:hypothetical protein